MCNHHVWTQLMMWVVFVPINPYRLRGNNTPLIHLLILALCKLFVCYLTSPLTSLVTYVLTYLLLAFSTLTVSVRRQEGHPACKNLRMRIDFTFLVPAHPDSPRQGAVKRVLLLLYYRCLCDAVKRTFSQRGGAMSPLSVADADKITLSLLCPLSRRRITLPARGIECTHMQVSLWPLLNKYLQLTGYSINWI